MKGLLLINLGSPDSTSISDVKKYLDEFLMDKRVIGKSYIFRWILVKLIILNFRPKKSARAYKKIWWKEGSPLIVLSRRLFKKVSDLMHKSNELPIVSSKMKMSEAIIVMTAKHFGCLGVIDEDGYLKGVITDGDLRRNMQSGLLNLRTAEIMTFPFKTIDPNALAGEGLNIMNIHSITNLFVTIKGKPVGLLHVHDCLRAGLD